MQWRAGRVYDCGWDEFDVAVVDKDFPTRSMHVPVVSFTQKHAVLDTGFAIVDPMSTVMRLANFRRPIAGRKRTSAVSRDEHSTNG